MKLHNFLLAKVRPEQRQPFHMITASPYDVVRDAWRPASTCMHKASDDSLLGGKYRLVYRFASRPGRLRPQIEAFKSHDVPLVHEDTHELSIWHRAATWWEISGRCVI